MELTGIINKTLLLHLVGCLYYLGAKLSTLFHLMPRFRLHGATLVSPLTYIFSLVPNLRFASI